VVATSRDHLNIEAALVGRSLAPSLPVVLRLFDADLGRRVASTFSLKAAFSAATLGAARFTAVGPNAGRLATLRFAGAAYELRQRAARPGETVADIPAPGRVVAVVRKDGRLDLDASASRALAAGEIALVVAPVGSGDGTGQRV
jgi:hypothetical protein